MLVLARKPGQSIRITVGNEDIEFTILRVRGSVVTISFEAAKYVMIVRTELLDRQREPE